MNYKIVETESMYPDVLIYREKREDDPEKNWVVIVAIGRIDDEDDMEVYEVVEFLTIQTAKNYIKDFSVESANQFCEQNNLKYQA